jgi:hypothetical protein
LSSIEKEGWWRERIQGCGEINSAPMKRCPRGWGRQTKDYGGSSPMAQNGKRRWWMGA